MVEMGKTLEAILVNAVPRCTERLPERFNQRVDQVLKVVTNHFCECKTVMKLTRGGL